MPDTHIKIPDVTPIIRYVANGAQTVFPYPFPIFASEDITVIFDGALQYSGFTISNAGNTNGGNVTFDSAPDEGTVIVIERKLPLERLTDFIEGGDFSAQVINTELDFLLATVQQVSSDQASMLRYDEDEVPATLTLPVKSDRLNKVLGFDGSGNPVAVSAEGVMAAPDYTASGTGAVTRISADKFADMISVKDFGAIGDGVTNDTLAIQQALSAHNHVYVPAGTYLTTAPITLGFQQSLYGAGHSAIIKANSAGFNVIEMNNEQATLHNLRIENGDVGVKIFGRDGAAVQNTITDLIIVGANTGIMLDGYDDAAKPCYWNNISRVLIERPAVHGVHLTKSGAGDVPSSNKFYGVRVFSKSVATTGAGFYIEHGALNNAFMDCEANMDAAASQCVRIGADSDTTIFMNILTLATSGSLIPNIQLDSGSTSTLIYNLNASSDGAAILDNSGGDFDAYNAGFPEKNQFQRTSVTDMRAALLRYDTEYIDSAGTTSLDLSHSVHLVDTTNGAITLELPEASSADGAYMLFKKNDSSYNIITITENNNGPGPDGDTFELGGQYDYIGLISNGAKWLIVSSNRMSAENRYYDTTGTIDIDMSVNVYLLSSFNGALTAQLPPADAEKASGRTITIKKTDSSSNVITITEQGGNGPDQTSQSLISQYDAITVMSDGSQWYVISVYG